MEAMVIMGHVRRFIAMRDTDRRTGLAKQLWKLGLRRV